MIGEHAVADSRIPREDQTVPTFQSDGVEIAYIDEGGGDPVLLIHGFASNVETNWVSTGWVKP